MSCGLEERSAPLVSTGSVDLDQNPGFLKTFFAEIHELILKFMWTFKGPRIATTILEKKNR